MCQEEGFGLCAPIRAALASNKDSVEAIDFGVFENVLFEIFQRFEVLGVMNKQFFQRKNLVFFGIGGNYERECTVI